MLLSFKRSEGIYVGTRVSNSTRPTASRASDTSYYQPLLKYVINISNFRWD